MRSQTTARRAPRGRTARVLAAGAGSLLALTACSGGEGGTLTVFAAASMEGVLTELTDVWNEDHAEELVFSYGGSNGLVDQLVEGAPADVLITADTVSMDRALEEGVAEDPAALATNSLVLALAPGNPGGYADAEDALTGERLVVCAPDVPCGRATVTLMELNGLQISPVSEELNVTDVRGKVESGEANSGVIYQTDAKAAGLDALEILRAGEVITTVMSAKVPDAGTDGASFLEFLHSGSTRAVLDSYGFGTP